MTPMCSPDRLGDNGPRLVGERPGDHGAAAEEEHRPDHIEDHEQDEPGGTGVGAVEARRPLAALGGLPHPNDREGDDRYQHCQGDEVLQEPEHGPATDERDREVLVEQRAVGLEIDAPEDDEAPEGEQVRQPGDRPLQQFPLPEHLDQLGPQPRAQVLTAVDVRLARAKQGVQPLDPPSGHRQRQDGQAQPDHQSHCHHSVHLRDAHRQVRCCVKGVRSRS
jgi:hypothetical protein